MLWTVVDERTICRFTSDAKDRPSRELKHMLTPHCIYIHVHDTMNVGMKVTDLCNVVLQTALLQIDVEFLFSSICTLCIYNNEILFLQL